MKDRQQLSSVRGWNKARAEACALAPTLAPQWLDVVGESRFPSLDAVDGQFVVHVARSLLGAWMRGKAP